MSRPDPQFITLLETMFAQYGKPLPDAPVIGAWWNALSSFPQATVQQAFSAYSVERPDFAPVPNSIAARCRLLDGRPTDDEAWATSLTSLDERATVVWTQEMAEAFRLCRPVLDAGDEVGARMAFKDAYNRLVAKARAEGRPVNWSVSAGWDAGLRQVAVETAARQGLLEAPKLAAIGFSGQFDAQVYPEGLRRVKELVAGLEDPREKAERIRLERVQAKYEAEQKAKLEIDARVKQYQSDNNKTGETER